MPPDFPSHVLSPLTLIGIISLIGLYAGFVARKVRLPALIGYMILGILVGPSILGWFDDALSEKLSFITEVALGFVAFSIGAELSLASLRRLGSGIITIIFAESFAAFFAVAIGVYLLTRDLPMALVFGAMAPASAPAGTVAVIQENNAKGSLTKALYAVVGFDDGLAIIIFGFAAALAKSLLVGEATGNMESILPAMWAPFREIGASLAVGTILGFGFCQLVRRLTATSDLLIIVFGIVLVATGLSIRWHLSLILTNMVVGFVLVNTRRESLVHRVTSSFVNVMPLLFVLFFCLAGAHLHIGALPSLGLVGVVYIFARAAGLIGGARLGATLGHVEEKIRKYIGWGILSQAGVAIGLSLIVKQDFDQLGALHPGFEHATNIGTAVLTTITATCVVFEIVGPICTKIALQRAGEIPSSSPGKHRGE